MQLAGPVAIAFLLNAALAWISTAAAISHSASQPSHSLRKLRAASSLQLKADLKGAATKLQAVLADVEATFAKARKQLVVVRDHCQVEAGLTSTRIQVQETKIDGLQATRELELQKQAEAEAALQIMQNGMDQKVQSYQSTVALRAKEATSFYSWNNTNAEYARVLDSTVDILEKRSQQLGKANATNLGKVQGVLEGMRLDVVSKTKELSTKHAGQDANFLTLVNSQRQSLRDSQAAYTTKRIQKDGFMVAARDAKEERDVRKTVTKSETSVLEILVHLCAKKSGKVPRTIHDGDVLLTSVQSRVNSTTISLNSMPNVSGVFLALSRRSKPRQTSTISLASEPAAGDAVAARRQEEMKRLAAQIKSRQAARPRMFVSHRAASSMPRKAIVVKIPTRSAHAIPSRGTGATAIRTLSASLDHIVTSAVALARRHLSAKAMPTTTNGCVKEKQRIAANITLERANIQDAETKKKLAETRIISLDNNIQVANDGKTALMSAFNGFSQTWMPLMTLIGTDGYNQDMIAAISKLDGVETDVNAYIAQGGPPASAGLPIALRNVKAAIVALRDEVQADLVNLQTLFTGSLMVQYPMATNDLSLEVTAMEKVKTQAAQNVTQATQALSTATAKESQLRTEWDQVEAACAPLLKGPTGTR